MKSDEDIFADALGLDATARAAFLDRACGDDRARRERIEALLHAYGNAATGFMVPTREHTVPVEEKPSMRIGRYKLLEQLGEGGCGVVWMAEQSEPVRRRVALKVIKLGMDTKAVIARFEAERQALAMMDHPNIAKVYDAGTTDAGRPYFVMELVRGVPITRFCDEDNLSTSQRLELFIQVCQAIQHAHQKGIIHRDIKPSNILVTRHDDKAVPMVIDFGIAKATQGRLTDQTLFTAFAQFMGTPAYMSPEQSELNAIDVDARSDVYSLGVLLYELLTGRPPFDPKSLVANGLDEIRRIIREVEPPRPSTRLSTLTDAERTTLARQRGMAPAQLSTLMRGDLDWIVMKALEKNRVRRYDSASAFAGDVQRFLAHEPVVARPPSAGYLLGKMIRRHRVAFATVTAVALALVAGAVVSTWQALRATRAERIALQGEQEQRRLREAAQRAQAAEAELRTQAEAQRLAARRRAYVSDMNVLQEAVAADNFGRARQLLERQRPQLGELDLRGWEWRYLWQFCQDDSVSVLSNEPMYEAGLAVSEDGTLLATAESLPDRVRIWNLRTRQATTVPLPENCTMPVVAFVPQQPWLVMGWRVGKDFRNQKGFFRVWNYATQQVVKDQETFYGPTKFMVAPDGKSMVALHWNSAFANIWQIPEISRTQRHLMGHPHTVTRDRRLSARVGLRSSAIEVEDYTENKISAVGGSTDTPLRTVWKTPPLDPPPTSLAFSHDGKILAAARSNPESTIILFEAETGREIGKMTGHSASIKAMVFWPDGKTLATAAMDQTIRIWDVETRTLRRTLRGHIRPVHELVLLPDNTTLVSSSGDGTVRFWDTTGSRPPAHFMIERPPIGSHRWYFTPDGKSVVAMENVAPAGQPDVKRENKAMLARFHGPQFRERTFMGGPEANSLFCLANDVPMYAALQFDAKATGKGVVHIWNYERNEKVREIPIPEEAANPVAFTDRGKKLLLEYWDKNEALRGLAEWDVETGKKLRSWSRATTQGVPVVSHDGRQCLVRPVNVIGQYPFSYQGELVLPHDAPCSIIDLASGIERKIDGLQAGFRPAQFSNDGRFFIAATGISLSVWETTSFQRVKSIEANGSIYAPQGALFSPDGGRMVAVSRGADAVRFWDWHTGEQVLRLAVPETMMTWPAFSPDGNTLGAMSTTGTLHFWRAPSWAEIEAAEKFMTKR